VNRGIAALLAAAWLAGGGLVVYSAAAGHLPRWLIALGALAVVYGALWLRVSLEGRLLGPTRRRRGGQRGD
jgi:hypothetical protein